jgi:hypothetical protein
MKKTSRTLIVAAAMTGLMAGSNPQIGRCDSTNAVPGQVAPEKKTPTAHGCAGQNDCKGIGGCKSGDNGCKFKNSCKGKGGCEITAKDIKTWQKTQDQKTKP